MDFASTIPSLPISVAVKAVAADAIAAGPSPSTMPAPMSIIPCFSLSTARMTNVEDMGYRMANRAKYQLRTPATRLQMDSLGCFWGFLTGCLLIWRGGGSVADGGRVWELEGGGVTPISIFPIEGEEGGGGG